MTISPSVHTNRRAVRHHGARQGGQPEAEADDDETAGQNRAVVMLAQPVAEVGQTVIVSQFPGTKPIVEHHPCASERYRQRRLLTRRGIETVVISQVHVEIIFDSMAKYKNNNTGGIVSSR